MQHRHINCGFLFDRASKDFLHLLVQGGPLLLLHYEVD